MSSIRLKIVEITSISAAKMCGGYGYLGIPLLGSVLNKIFVFIPQHRRVTFAKSYNYFFPESCVRRLRVLVEVKKGEIRPLGGAGRFAPGRAVLFGQTSSRANFAALMLELRGLRSQLESHMPHGDTGVHGSVRLSRSQELSP